MTCIASGSEYGDNSIRMQPGMIVHLGRDEKWEPIEVNAKGLNWRIMDSSNLGRPTYIAEPCYPKSREIKRTVNPTWFGPNAERLERGLRPLGYWWPRMRLLRRWVWRPVWVSFCEFVGVR